VVLQTDHVPVLRRGVPLPARLADVLDEALADRPTLAFPSAAELRRALEGT
jgi:hypothetical protein